MRASLIVQALATAIGVALLLVLDFIAQRDDQRAGQLIAAWAVFVSAYVHLVMKPGRVAASAGFVAGAFGSAVAVLLYDQHQRVAPPQAFLVLVGVSLLFSLLTPRTEVRRG